jgi:hypothetical protein
MTDSDQDSLHAFSLLVAVAAIVYFIVGVITSQAG